MSNDGGETLRKVAWTELLPWLNIFRTFRLAISLRVLLLAAVAAFLTLSGWAVLGRVFSAGEEMSGWMSPAGGCPWLAVDEAVPGGLPFSGTGAREMVPPDVPGRQSDQLKDLARAMQAEGAPYRTRVVRYARWPLAGPAWEAPDPFFGTWAHLSAPLWAALRLNSDVATVACLLLCGLWSLAIWAFFGGAITRIAAVELACDERVGWAPALRFACSKWLSYFGGPLFPAVGIALIGIPAFLMGLLMLAGGVGIVIAAVVWPLLMAAGLLMAVLLLGLIFGWPLMWPTISAEGTDSFDALSRSYNYLFRRPLHYLFYAIVAALLGALGWLLVKAFAGGVIGLTYWAASWGCGTEQIAAVLPGSESPLTTVGAAGAWLIHLWTVCVKLLAVGFVYGYFWTASTAIYFLLRRDEDQTEMDEVYLDEDASEPSAGVPPLETDEAGAPAVSEDVPEVVPDEDQGQSEDELREDRPGPEQ